MRSFALFIAALSLSAPACFAGTDKTLLSAREAILSSTATHQAILLKYIESSKKTDLAAVMAEYSYALAYTGLGEAALYNVDHALITEPLDPDVRFYLSEVLNAAGLEDASSEISAPVPAWLKTPLKLSPLEVPAPDGDFEKASAGINVLMAQKRYAESAVLYDRLCKKVPGNARCRAGYAISLEKLGAYKTAAAEAKKDLELSPSPEHKAVAGAYISDLEKRLPLKYTAEKPTLKGRYLAYLGGGVTRSDGRNTSSFSGRLGRFLSERLDVSANAALSGGNPDHDYNGLTLGLSGRYNKPLVFAPLNWTLAA